MMQARFIAGDESVLPAPEGASRRVWTLVLDKPRPNNAVTFTYRVESGQLVP
jgi:hypothetical protein